MTSNANEQPVDGDLEKAPATVKDGGPEDEDEYPPFAKVVIIMTALYLAMFLVALVCLKPSRPEYQLTSVGSNNSGNSHPQDHGRLPFNR